MKYLLSLILLSLIVNTAFAQITITDDDLPDGNEEYIYSQAILNLSVFQNYADTDTNYNWDFSDLIPSRQSVERYNFSWQTIYALFFLGFDKFGKEEGDITFGGFGLTDVQTFYDKNSSRMRAEGLGFRFQGIPIPAFYSDEDVVYKLPLEYGDSDVSNFSLNAGIPGFGSFDRSGRRQNEVDGWGTVTTPLGTFDCIRLVSDVNRTDALTIDSFTIPIPIITRSYQWLAKGKGIPVLEVTGNVLFNFFIPTSARYKDTLLINNIDFVADTLTPLINETVQLTNTSQVPLNTLPTYQWSITPSTYTLLNGSTLSDDNISLSFQEAVPYAVQLLMNSSLGQFDTLKVNYIEPIDPTVAIESISSAEIKLYPNPVSDAFTVEIPNSWQVQAWELRDTAGKLVKNGKGRLRTLNVSDLATAQYTLLLRNTEQQTVAIQLQKL